MKPSSISLSEYFRRKRFGVSHPQSKPPPMMQQEDSEHVCHAAPGEARDAQLLLAIQQS